MGSLTKLQMPSVLILLLTMALSPVGVAQEILPRTPDQRPDLQGVWATEGLTTLERMRGATMLVASDADATSIAQGYAAFLASPAMGVEVDPAVFDADVRTLLRVNGEWRTSQITEPADGKLPLSVEGHRLVGEERAASRSFAGPEVRPVAERCLVGSGPAPMFLLPVVNVRQIVQTSDSLVISSEGDTRIVGIGAEHRPSAIKTWLGDSTARWEGDVLVIETINAKARAVPFPTDNQIVQPQSRVIERLHMLAPNEIVYQFTVEDSTVYTKPWSAEFSLHRTYGAVYEYGCHEGNYSIVNILRAARLSDAAPGQ